MGKLTICIDNAGPLRGHCIVAISIIKKWQYSLNTSTTLVQEGLTLTLIDNSWTPSSPLFLMYLWMTPNEIGQDCCKNYGLFLPSQTDIDKDNKKPLQRVKMVYCTLQMGEKTYKRSKQTVFDFTLLCIIQWKDEEVLDYF